MTAGRRQHTCRASGLTLIELLVALTILAILLSSVYGTFISAMRATRLAREDEGPYQVARVVMDRITKDLEMAYYRPDADRPQHPTQVFIGLDRSDGDYAQDRLDLTTASHALVHDGRPETDLAEVSYYIDTTYWERPLLVRREDPLPDEDLRHGGTLRVLAENVVSLNFRYREPGPQPSQRQRMENKEPTDEEAEEDQPEWYDTWNAAEFNEPYASLPELVEVTLVLREKDEDGEDVEYTFSTTVQLNPYQSWRGAGRRSR